MSNYTLRDEGCFGIEYVVVQMADHAPFPPTADEQGQLQRIVSHEKRVLVDLKATKRLETHWLRLFAELTERAEKIDHEFALTGVAKPIRECISYVGLSDHLREAVLSFH